MAGLAEKLLSSEHKDSVVADCVQLLEAYVANRSGLKGIGMRAGLSIAKSRKPDIVVRSTYWLLPEFLEALNPLYVIFKSKPRSSETFQTFLHAHSADATEALLQVADLRVNGTPNMLVKKTYLHFRSEAEDEVTAILPELGKLIERHLSGAPDKQPA
jgi:hypothetical protein